MSQITVVLQPNVWSETSVSSDRLSLLSMINTSTGAPLPSVNLELIAERNGRQAIDNAVRGLKVRMLPQGGALRLVRLRSTVGATVTFISSDQLDVDQTGDGNTVAVTNPAGGVLAVSNDRGSPGLPVYVSTVVGGTPAVSMAGSGPFAVAGAAVALVAALANRKAVRFGNIGAGPVALGPAAVTWAARSVLLQPGDVWVEDQAANLAWYGICDGITGASVTVQEVLA